MAEPRRISTRFRGEPPPKKRALTRTPPPARATPAKKEPPAPSPEVVEEGLPTKLKEGQPLPTLPEPQDEILANAAFQSISESGVLAAAIERSRQKWMNDGIFERYWTKPSKKKGAADGPQPAKESMSRLGTCCLVIEPHTFDITLYTVKDVMSYQYPAFPPPPPQPPSFSQYSAYPQNPSYPASYGAPFTGSAVPDHRSPPAQQMTLPPFRQGFGQFDSNTNLPPVNDPPPPATSPAPPPESRRMSKSSSGSRESQLKENASSDPVIRMLATRASSDPRLKSLMKIVAAGNASPEQLKEFQSHIDELNTLLKSPPSPKRGANNDKTSPQPPPPPIMTSPPPVASPNPPPPKIQTSPQPPIHSSPPPPGSAPPPVKTEPTPAAAAPPTPTYFSPFSPQPPPPPLHQTKPPAPLHRQSTPKSDITAVVFDFTAGNGDRFSIPRFSILDYLPGGLQVLVSFLAIRRGSTAAVGPSSKNKGYYKDSKSYYQPIPIRISAHHPRLLEPLARVVASVEEVRRYMDGVFDKMAPAEKVYLPLRLPREKVEDDERMEKEKEKAGSAVAKGKAAASSKREEDDEVLVRSWYEPPSSMMPLPA